MLVYPRWSVYLAFLTLCLVDLESPSLLQLQALGANIHVLRLVLRAKGFRCVTALGHAAGDDVLCPLLLDLRLEDELSSFRRGSQRLRRIHEVIEQRLEWSQGQMMLELGETCVVEAEEWYRARTAKFSVVKVSRERLHILALFRSLRPPCSNGLLTCVAQGGNHRGWTVFGKGNIWF